jgi:predicted permease
LFDVLGVRPVRGRTFVAGEDRPGAEPVIVIGWGMWQQDLGGDPDILGKRILVGGRPTTVIGVMPQGFWFPTPEFRAWLPLDLDPAGSTYQNNGWLVLIGRLKSTATPATVTGDLQTFTRALGERFTYPEAWDKTKNAHVKPLREYLLGDVEPTMLLLLGAVGLLLLMACTNAAALILARTTDRTGEIAVRTALGAGRGRLARQIFTESITLAVIAGVVGAVVAAAIFDVLVASLPLQSGFGDTLSLDWTTFAAAFALVLLVGLAVSAIPIRHLLQGRLDGAISGERSDAGLRRGAGRAHAVLVTAEVTLAVLLAVGATLLIRTVDRIRALDPGFDPAHVITLDLVASPQDMDPDVRWNFFRELLTRVEALPGVGAAGYTNRLPVRDGGWQGPVTIESRPDLADAKRPNSLFRWATPGFFEAMGIEIEQGRGIEVADRRGAVPVALVSESFAQKMWPGREALGQRIMLNVVGEPDWRTVVGVFEETRMVSMLGENPMVFYIPFEQSPFPGEGQALVIRTEGDPAGVVAAVRRLVAELDPRVAVARVAPMEDVVATALAEPLRLRFFLSLFAGLALLLGTVGVYGVVSYSVGRRRAEFGIRMALGAAPRRVIGDVVRGGMLPVGVGVLAGLLASIALSRVVGRFLFQIAPTDPLSLATAGLALLGAGVLAALVPAWRAGRVSPVEALRAE